MHFVQFDIFSHDQNYYVRERDRPLTAEKNALNNTIHSKKKMYITLFIISLSQTLSVPITKYTLNTQPFCFINF